MVDKHLFPTYTCARNFHLLRFHQKGSRVSLVNGTHSHYVHINNIFQTKSNYNGEAVRYSCDRRFILETLHQHHHQQMKVKARRIN